MLRLERVARRFGGLEAVKDLDLDVPAGARLGLIGPNGSGKTTVLNLVSGVLAPDGGAIRLDGARIDGLPAHRFARLGIARTFQNVLRLVAHMTVRENVARAAHAAGAARRARRGPARGARPRGLGATRRSRPCRCRSRRWPSWPARSPASRKCCCSTSRPAG
ncbi:MAG: ATP-binding cassette domain-containing protein [Alphaproteobacteria bacterium]